VKAWPIASAGVLAAGAWVVYTFPPAATAWYPKCVFRMVTGLLCPGCGITRALHHLLHGRFEQAMQLNPLLFLLLFVMLCAVPSLVRGERPGFLARPWFAWSALAVLVSWWIVRNTPLYPFPA
jgi:Protein of unknown function (DUF2752)